MGLWTPWTFVPHTILTYDDQMTYPQRMHNVLVSLYDWWFRQFVVLPRQDEIAQRHFGHIADSE